MATAVGDLVIRLGAQTGRADSRLNATRALMMKVKATAMSLMMAIAPLGGAYMFAGLIKSGEQFERKMRNSLAIMGDVSKAMKEKMRDTAFEVAAATVASAEDATEAYYFLASAGLNAAQSIAALPAVANFAQAGNFGMALATDLATDAQSALGLTVKDTQQNLENLTRVTDVLIKANTLANASAEQFSQSLTNKAGAAMRTVGMEIEEGVAILAAWADQGIKAQDAGTALNIVLRELQSKALTNADAFKENGVAVFDSAGELRKIADIVESLEKRLDGCSDAQKKLTLMQMGFTSKSVIFIQTLLGTSEKIRRYNSELDKAGGTCKKVAEKQLTPIQKGLAALGSIATKLGTVIVEKATPAILGLFNLIGWSFKKLVPLIGLIVKFTMAMLAAKVAIALVTVAIRVYTAATQAAAGMSAFLLAVAGPAGWFKLAAGAIAATAAIAAMNKTMADMPDATAKIAEDSSQMGSDLEKVGGALKEIGEQSGPILGTAGAVDELASSAENLMNQILIAGPKQFGETLREAILWTSRLSARAGTGTLTPEKTDVEQYNTLVKSFQSLRNAPGVLGDMATGAAAAMENLLLLADRAQGGAISADQFTAAAQDSVAELKEMSSWLDTVLGNFASLEDAVKYSSEALGSIRTPAETLEQTRKKIKALVDLGLIEAADATRLWGKALGEFDSAIGGPVSRIGDLRNELLQLTSGLTQAEMELRKLAATEGVRPEQIETIRKLQQEIDRVKAGKELTEAMQTPAEKALQNVRAEVARIEGLFGAGAIDEETRRRALEAQLGELEGKRGGEAGDGPVGAGAALKKGSAEAFSAILAAGAKRDGPGKQTAKNTDAIRIASQNMAVNIQKMIDGAEAGIDIPA